jgi:hypothetical protein
MGEDKPNIGTFPICVFGWWWADPFAGLVMVSIIAKEGADGVRGRRVAVKGRPPGVKQELL